MTRGATRVVRGSLVRLKRMRSIALFPVIPKGGGGVEGRVGLWGARGLPGKRNRLRIRGTRIPCIW